jgi:hypothetical protein
MTGGVVFAEGKDDGRDIGAGDNGSGGSLNLSGTVALFLYNDRSVLPVTTTHTHQIFYGHGGGSIYGIPVAWTQDEIGAYLRIYTLSYDANGGAGTAAAPGGSGVPDGGGGGGIGGGGGGGSTPAAPATPAPAPPAAKVIIGIKQLKSAGSTAMSKEPWRYPKGLIQQR